MHQPGWSKLQYYLASVEERICKNFNLSLSLSLSLSHNPYTLFKHMTSDLYSYHTGKWPHLQADWCMQLHHSSDKAAHNSSSKNCYHAQAVSVWYVQTASPFYQVLRRQQFNRSKSWWWYRVQICCWKWLTVHLAWFIPYSRWALNLAKQLSLGVGGI